MKKRMQKRIAAIEKKRIAILLLIGFGCSPDEKRKTAIEMSVFFVPEVRLGFFYFEYAFFESKVRACKKKTKRSVCF